MDRTAVAKQLLVLARELVAIDFPTKDAMDIYLDAHPGVDKSKHRVVENKDAPKQQTYEIPKAHPKGDAWKRVRRETGDDSQSGLTDELLKGIESARTLTPMNPDLKRLDYLAGRVKKLWKKGDEDDPKDQEILHEALDEVQSLAKKIIDKKEEIWGRKRR